jgi:hypothetical protein
MNSSVSFSYVRSIVSVMRGGHKDSKSPRILEALVLPMIYCLCFHTTCDSREFGRLVSALFVEVRSIRDLLSSGSIFCDLV